MRALFWLLTLAALAIGAALLGRLSEGYVLWVVPPWRVEVSFNLYVLAQFAALLVLYLLLRAIVNTLRLPRVVGEFRARRSRQRDERAAAEALRLFWEGRYVHALKSAEKVGAGGTASAMVALIGLKAAHALHDAARIGEWHERALASEAGGAKGGDWRPARLMTEIALALDLRDFAGAAAGLEQLGPKERRQISAQRLALRLAQGQGDWAEMLRITRTLENHRALTPEQAQPLRMRAHRGMLETLQDDPVQLVRYWYDMSVADCLDQQLVQRAVRALNAVGACAESARIIEDTLDERWDSALLEDYAHCAGGDVLGRIAHCEKWLHAHPDDAQLLLVLGRLCAQRQLWGKAQSYLEAALAVSPSAEAHLDLAQLLDQLERPDEANRHYRAAAKAQNQIQSRGGRKSL